MSHIPSHKNKENYNSFVFFSAGPVGDHAMILDFANRFFESTGKPSYILSKHKNRFLSDLLLPYQDHITEIGVKEKRDILSLVKLIFKSIFIKHCYLLVFAIPHPSYLKAFAFFIRYFTRSRIVGLTSLCGFTMSGGPKESSIFLGKRNYLPAHVDTQLFYEQANNLLFWLGYQKVDHSPTLTFIEDKTILEKEGLVGKEYIVFHLVASTLDKSLPPERWNFIIYRIMQTFPDIKIVFSGAVGDSSFVKSSIHNLDMANVVNLCGKTNMRQLLTTYSQAKTIVSVHTGNAMLMNMLHLRTVIVNMKGVYMFKYHFNKNSIDLTSDKGCTCNPYERDCTSVEYKGNKYMSCVFNNDDDEIVDAIIKQLRS